jgi:hypothetical protein
VKKVAKMGRKRCLKAKTSSDNSEKSVTIGKRQKMIFGLG